MKGDKIVGYYLDGVFYCANCFGEPDPNTDDYPPDPVFAGSVWDSAPSCDECLCALDVCVIGYTPNVDDCDDSPSLTDTFDHADPNNR